MSIKEPGKNWILVGIVMVAVFAGMVGTVSAYIDIRDLGIEELEDGIGYIEFQNVVDDIFLEEDEEYYIRVLLKVYNDGKLIVSEGIKLDVVSFHGFAVNVLETKEFEVEMTEGLHNLIAYIETDKETVNETLEYKGEVEVEEEEEVEIEEEDWLPCPSEKEDA